jgi:hypothetical protein
VATHAHGFALLLEGRCRACAERLPGGTALRGLPCPRCEAPTAPTGEDRAELAARLGARATTRLWIAVLLVGLATLLPGWAPLAASLTLAAGLAWVAAAIVRPGLRLLPTGRRLVAAWTLRIVGAGYLAVLVIFVELLTLLSLPGLPLKAAVTASQVALGGWFARSYLGWQAARALRQEPIAAGELAFLAAAAAALAAALTGTMVALSWLLERLAAAAGVLG